MCANVLRKPVSKQACSASVCPAGGAVASYHWFRRRASPLRSEEVAQQQKKDGRSDRAAEAEEEDVDVDDVLAEDTEEFTKVETANSVKDDKDSETVECETPTDKKVVKITPPSTSGERLQKRAERFNMPATSESKKAIRAARSRRKQQSCCGRWPTEEESGKVRHERVLHFTKGEYEPMEDDEKLKKRKERFGVSAVAKSGGGDEAEVKKLKRAERFGKE
ncbi:hypothetical protein F2P81_011281 [Scophthalmus maximus]|uniref:Uncharacterized protein n=1 Tax=Scophthalmus maximus TaxID=52904 RepID=A0A6A4STE7_SCOMX|nr:hypothetical protein F2P81_011281 [Scophthalmus maximus]